MRNLLLLFFIFCTTPNLWANSDEMLIIFTQASDQHFKTIALPDIRAYALEKGIRLVEKSATEGVPENITTTPAIIYQNAKGRSIYASRYAEFSTIRNFIRTSKVVPQQQALLDKTSVLLWQTGRTQVAASLKVTEAQGKVPSNWTATTLAARVQQVFADHMQHFKTAKKVLLARTDRLFYLDIHPYVSANQEVYLSMEIYSQYSCKDPIFSNFAAPLKGTINSFDSLLEQAAKQLADEIASQMKTSKIGDAFSPISNAIPIKSWEALGLSLPVSSQMNKNAFVDAPALPEQWTFHQAIEAEVPIVQFRFPAPLDRYIGEIQKMVGDLQWT
ncbi:MAG: hypothetical protein AAF847_18935, partial [Bacteroidota bacterium]